MKYLEFTRLSYPLFYYSWPTWETFCYSSIVEENYRIKSYFFSLFSVFFLYPANSNPVGWTPDAACYSFEKKHQNLKIFQFSSNWFYNRVIYLRIASYSPQLNDYIRKTNWEFMNKFQGSTFFTWFSIDDRVDYWLYLQVMINTSNQYYFCLWGFK